jgi:REP element-mobilizing transposase RayT
MHFWAKGYLVGTVGGDREIIKNYVKEQHEDQIREDKFQLSEDNCE